LGSSEGQIMPNLGPTELIIILVIVLLVFGVGKLGDAGAALGKGVREFKKATKELEGAKGELEDTANLAKIDSDSNKPQS
jgi:sec-independent protein translocase protein TatA